MGSKTAENADPETDVPAESHAPHPLDSWLKRELKALYGESGREALPPGIAELADRLEEKLREAKRAPGDAGTDKGEDPATEPGRKSTRQGRKR